MQKFSYRKYAIAALSLLMVGTMAACSGASSSDEALSHPGNLVGTVQFDVDPAGSNVTVTPVGSPWISTKVVGDGAGNIPNVTITTANVAYVSPNMDFDVRLTWSDPDEDLWNVRLQTNATTNVNVDNLTDDRCVAGNWGTCLSGANPPAITFVSDLTAEGPESKNQCAPGGVVCSTQYRNNLNAGCGQISTHWTLNESGGAGYRFWADLYGTKAPIDPLLDPRYDQYTTTTWNVVKKLTYATTNNPAEGANSNSMVPNEWFYVHLYADNPGNNQPWPYYYADLDANGGFLATQHIEDTGNVAAWQSGAVSSANYWYVGRWLPYSLRFDTAVLETPSNDVGGIAPVLPGTGKFYTKVGGTRITFIGDVNGTADGWNATGDGFTSSNNYGMIFALGNKPNALGNPLQPPNPCNNGAVSFFSCPGGSRDGFANLDIDIVRLPLHVKATAVSGQTSFIAPSYDSYTLMAAYSTEGSAYDTGTDWGQPVLYSPNWPNWCERMPNGVCNTTGQYNMTRSYVCVQ